VPNITESLCPAVSSSFFRLQCECQHNTCGESCDRCCPGFKQKPWRAATVDSPNECQRECSCAIRHTEQISLCSSPCCWLLNYSPKRGLKCPLVSHIKSQLLMP
ncbi:hypothetical protein GOODEAATRI_024558, partial [Goodea atripinnis]